MLELPFELFKHAADALERVSHCVNAVRLHLDITGSCQFGSQMW